MRQHRGGRGAPRAVEGRRTEALSGLIRGEKAHRRGWTAPGASALRVLRAELSEFRLRWELSRANGEKYNARTLRSRRRDLTAAGGNSL